MRTMQVREARAKFSAIIKAAENGQATIITKNGKPAAVVLPVNNAQKLYPEFNQAKQRNLIEFLLSYSDGVELERDETPPGQSDLQI